MQEERMQEVRTQEVRKQGVWTQEAAAAGPPLVSVITATYNAAATLESCLSSVRAQDYRALEHIVIDAASTDGTVELLKASEGSLAAVLSERDDGVYDAWNKGLARAKGEWIAFLGADDVYLPGAVSAYMALAATKPDAEYLSSQVRWVRADGKTRMIGQAWHWHRFARYMCTAHAGSMHRRILFQRYGTYDISYRIVGDYELLLRPGAALRAAFLPQTTVEMKAGGLSDSYAAIEESVRAKTGTGVRKAGAARIDAAVAKVKLRARRAML